MKTDFKGRVKTCRGRENGVRLGTSLLSRILSRRGRRDKLHRRERCEEKLDDIIKRGVVNRDEQFTRFE